MFPAEILHRLKDPHNSSFNSKSRFSSSNSNTSSIGAVCQFYLTSTSKGRSWASNCAVEPKAEIGVDCIESSNVSTIRITMWSFIERVKKYRSEKRSDKGGRKEGSVGQSPVGALRTAELDPTRLWIALSNHHHQLVTPIINFRLAFPRHWELVKQFQKLFCAKVVRFRTSGIPKPFTVLLANKTQRAVVHVSFVTNFVISPWSSLSEVRGGERTC